MKILIADDDPAFRQLLEKTLTRWGYEVVVSRNGNEALQQLYAEGAPQLAIFDWLMPGMDGLEACRKVRQEKPEPYTYIILLTSQLLDADLVCGMDAGADDYITKPFKTDELRVRLNAGRRMIELQNELSVRASDLEAANRDLESFSYTVANDVLKSLLSIGDNANKIRDLSRDNNDEKYKTYAKRIYDNTKRLGELIGIMNDFFRPMRINIQRDIIDLSEMACKTAEILRQKNTERRATFKIVPGIKVNADRNLMQITLNNLLSNAWRHTVECEEAIIEFGVTDVDGKSAYFVRDNGTGFDMAHADRLFKPFQQLPGVVEIATDGIGLAMVERIIRRHGGRVWAEGELGKGATFYFTLPVEVSGCA